MILVTPKVRVKHELLFNKLDSAKQWSSLGAALGATKLEH